MTGSERAMLYELAIQTGLRSNELRSLKRSNLSLDNDSPFVTCEARSTKNRRKCRQYVRPSLAVSLRKHVARKSPEATVFTLPPNWQMAAMVREDLKAARVAYLDAAKNAPQKLANRQADQFLLEETADGHLDFHALRHTCGAWLARMEAHPKTIQAVMRHSSITLTMDRYGHLFPGQEAEAVARLDTLLIAKPITLSATGTAGKSPNDCQYVWQQSAHDSMPGSAKPCETNSPATETEPFCIPLQNAALCNPPRHRATGCKNGTAETRTPNQRIMSPLL